MLNQDLKNILILLKYEKYEFLYQNNEGIDLHNNGCDLRKRRPRALLLPDSFWAYFLKLILFSPAFLSSGTCILLNQSSADGILEGLQNLLLPEAEAFRDFQEI